MPRHAFPHERVTQNDKMEVIRVGILVHHRSGDEKKMTRKYTKNPARRIPA